MIVDSIQLINDIVNKTLKDVLSKNIVDKNLTSYINSLYNSFSFTKNIIFRTTPIDFLENYIPLTLKGNKSIIRLSDPLKLIEDYNNIILIGNAGSGKTTILKFISLKCIESKRYIPVFIELRKYYENNIDFESYVAMMISKETKNDILKTFNSGNFIFLFDGFDEINYLNEGKLINEILSFILKYSQNKFIITSRPGTNIESLSNFYVFEISTLKYQDIELYIQKINLPNDHKTKLTNLLLKNDDINKIIYNPLFLNIFINSIDSLTSKPLNISLFLRQVFDSLLREHDSISKFGYQRQKISNLTSDSLETICTFLAFISFFQQKHSFSKDELISYLDLIKSKRKLVFENQNVIYDLTITLNILDVDPISYQFTHILIHEYLTTLFISKLDLFNKVNLYEKVINSDLSISVSFLDFLFELDYLNFLKYFLIPLIGGLISSIEKEEIETTIKNSFIRNNRFVINTFLNKTYFSNENLPPLSIINLRELSIRLTNECEQKNYNYIDLINLT